MVWFDITDLKITQFVKRLSEMNVSLTEKCDQDINDNHANKPTQRETVDGTVDVLSCIQDLARTTLKHVCED